MTQINQIPGGQGTVAFTGPNVGQKALTLQGEISFAQSAVVFEKKPNVHSLRPKFKGMYATGTFKVTGVLDQDVSWINRVIVEDAELTFTNGRIVQAVRVIYVAGGDENFQQNLTEGETNELVFHFDTATVIA